MKAGQRTAPKDCKPASPAGSPRGTSKVVSKSCTTGTTCRSGSGAVNMSKYANKPKLTGTAITFPFLEDFTEIFGLLMGEDADLVHLDLGTLRASAGVGLKFGPFMAGPVPIDIGVAFNIGFAAHLALGYDTLGIRNALTSESGEFNPAALLDGLYIDDFGADGVEAPEMTLTITVQVEGAVSVKIFRVGVYGGVTLTLAADLNDPDGDGKLRFSEITAISDPACLFDFKGTLEFFFGFFVEIDLFIDSIRYDVELFRLKPPITLFEIKCEPKPPVLAEKSGGDLVLKIGPNKTGRNVADDKDDERVKVRQLTARNAGPGNTTTVSVEMFGIYQEFGVPENGKIIANAGEGRDTLEFLPGVDLQDNTWNFTVPVKGDLGNGPDTAKLGDARDVVGGGADKDRITGGLGPDKLSGGEGDDIVAGGLGDDEVDGDAGLDNLSGDAGADVVRGGVNQVEFGWDLRQHPVQECAALHQKGIDSASVQGF
jgi:hypothetical protein